MLHATQIILKPLLTEKGTWETATRNRYRFQVHKDANKQMIRQAVQDLYEVRVTSVATQNRKGKTRRTRYGWSQTGDEKQAIVELHPDDRIDLL